MRVCVRVCVCVRLCAWMFVFVRAHNFALRACVCNMHPRVPLCWIRGSGRTAGQQSHKAMPPPAQLLEQGLRCHVMLKCHVMLW